MTPARWRRIAELFAGAIRSDPAGLATWPRLARGSDEDLHAQIGHILDVDQGASGFGSMRPQEPPDRGLEAVAAWPALARRSSRGSPRRSTSPGPDRPAAPASSRRSRRS